MRCDNWSGVFIARYSFGGGVVSHLMTPILRSDVIKRFCFVFNRLPPFGSHVVSTYHPTNYQAYIGLLAEEEVTIRYGSLILERGGFVA